LHSIGASCDKHFGGKPALKRPNRLLTLLLVAVGLLTFLIQSGDAGSSDGAARIQVAHSWWTGEPEVPAGEYPEFGILGRGKLHAWFGIGQSLLILPFDIIATGVERLPVFYAYADAQTDPTVRSIVVTFSVNILLNVLSALVAFKLLMLMEFTEAEAALGALALICASTHLYYAQNMQENNYICLLTLTGIYFQLRWALTIRVNSSYSSNRYLIAGSLVLGLNLLTRLTTALDAAFAAVLIALVLSQRGLLRNRSSILRLARIYISIAAPTYAVFLFFDRLYQFIRFGSWTNTYSALYGQEQRKLYPELPATFPFSGHWFQGGLNSGILGPFFSPRKSVLLFDPLLILSLFLLILLSRKLSPTVRSYWMATLLLLGAYVVLYGRYFTWAGDSAWGDRYVSTAVELVCLPTVPLLVRHWRSLSPAVRAGGATLCSVSFLLQLASIAFWCPLELYQLGDYSIQKSVQWLRIKNILAQFSLQFLGHKPSWAVPIPDLQDPWDLTHITTWNLLPSMLRHVGAAPVWAVYTLECIWAALLAALVIVLVRFVKDLRRTFVFGEP
jgi:hypothetical protein